MRGRNDLELYERNASRWWGVDRRFFRSLRSVGAFHLGQMRRAWAPLLAGARLVDLGCGGGLMAIPLAGEGARVTGIDRSPASVCAAEDEAGRRGSSARFACADLLASPLRSRSFDLAVMSDVLEHVEDPERAVREAGRLLRPGGRLFVNTFDRTRSSGLVVAGLAEALGLVPRGTHDARLFVRPAELGVYAKAAGLELERLVRERPLLLQSALSWTIHLEESPRGFGYSAFFRKVSSP